MQGRTIPMQSPRKGGGHPIKKGGGSKPLCTEKVRHQTTTGTE
jgi:hypothetical protein